MEQEEKLAKLLQEMESLQKDADHLSGELQSRPLDSDKLAIIQSEFNAATVEMERLQHKIEELSAGNEELISLRTNLHNAEQEITALQQTLHGKEFTLQRIGKYVKDFVLFKNRTIQKKLKQSVIMSFPVFVNVTLS